MELGILHSIIGEVWKPIKDFPNYVVSNRGRVYSFAREEIYCGVIRMRHGRFLVPRLGKQGYLYVALCKEGHTSTKKIHRLVAEAFLDNPNNLECVNHKDECRTNNNVENLEWCTVAYNVTYGDAKKKAQKRFIETGWAKGVEQYDMNGNLIGVFSSISESSRNSASSMAGICSCCRGSRNSDNGFIWKYKKAS